MIKATAGSRTPDVAKPDARDVEVLSELAELGLELARAFQAKAVKAAKAGDLDKAAAAEKGRRLLRWIHIHRHG